MTNKPRGRPKQFEPDRALKHAMKVFWEKGYESTSLEDLTQAMEIQRPSLYREFGDKEALFVKAIDHYLVAMGEQPRTALFADQDLQSSIEQFYYAVIENVAGSSTPPGCLVACVLSEAAPNNEMFQAKFKECLRVTDRMVKRRLDEAIASDQLPQDADTESMAKLINSVRHGLSVRARSGERKAALRKYAKLAAQRLIAAS